MVVSEDMQMQTPRTSKKSSGEGSRTRSASSETTRKATGQTKSQLKSTVHEVNSPSPSKPSIKITKSTSPIISARRSPKSPLPELQKKRPNRVAELETQIIQLEDDLKTVKDQLVSSESWKDQAQQDAEESRKQLLAMSSKLEESQNLLAQFSSQEPNEIQELQDLSEADEAWKSKLEAAKKLHSADFDALSAAINEIGELQVKLDEKSKSEAAQTEQAESAFAELNSLKETFSKTLSLVETMKSELKDCKSSESHAQALAKETLLQLETAKKKLKPDMKADCSKEHQFENRYEDEIIALKSEVGKLKFDVETAETRLNEEQSRRVMEITSAYVLVDEIKSNSRIKESELESELNKSREEIEELKANLMDKETELQGICEENEDLNSKMKNSLLGIREIELEKEIKSLKQDFNVLKSKLMITETHLNEKSNENEKLKLEIKKMDCKELLGCENESINKVNYLVEEIEQSNRKVARVCEQLDAAQTANCEMEAEMRKLKVQADQWRKAAEAAASVLSVGNNTNRKLMVKNNCSPYVEDIDDDDEEFLKKKNGNMLKRIGVLWKKRP